MQLLNNIQISYTCGLGQSHGLILQWPILIEICNYSFFSVSFVILYKRIIRAHICDYDFSNTKCYFDVCCIFLYRTFITPLVTSSHSPLFSSTQPLATTNILYLYGFTYSEHFIEMESYVAFCDWHLSLMLYFPTLSMLQHVSVLHSCLCEFTLFIHSSVDMWLFLLFGYCK